MMIKSVIDCISTSGKLNIKEEILMSKFLSIMLIKDTNEKYISGDIFRFDNYTVF